MSGTLGPERCAPAAVCAGAKLRQLSPRGNSELLKKIKKFPSVLFFKKMDRTVSAQETCVSPCSFSKIEPTTKSRRLGANRSGARTAPTAAGTGCASPENQDLTPLQSPNAKLLKKPLPRYNDPPSLFFFREKKDKEERARPFFFKAEGLQFFFIIKWKSESERDTGPNHAAERA